MPDRRQSRLASCLLGVLLALASVSQAADYYLDSEAGADSNAGTSATAPLQTLARLATVRLEPGDSVRLKRGRTFRGKLQIQGNGAAEQPLRITTYGEGPKPEILGSIEVRTWEPHADRVYRCRLPREPSFDTDVFSVFVYDAGTVPQRLLREKDAIPTAAGRFFHDKAAGLLYLTTPDGLPPEQHRIEVPVRDELLLLQKRAWIEIEGVALLFGNRRHVVIGDSQTITLRNCASLFVGAYGNPNVSISRSTNVEVLGCFLYENANCGVFITDQSTQCRVADCTIVKCLSNDGITLHSGGRDASGARRGITGDRNRVENNVIGLCPEESIDITSGDEHIIQGNLCYGNGNPGIIVGHDSDHILIRNNIAFANRRAGIQVSGQAEEGGRGANLVIGNLVYDNGYPGLELDSPECLVRNNTVVNSRERVAVRLSDKARGSQVLNNIIVTTDPGYHHPSVQFMLGTPASFAVRLDGNLYFNVSRPDGRLIQTTEGNFSPAELAAKYGTGAASLIANPRFRPTPERYYLLAPDSPACGKAATSDWPAAAGSPLPDLGWKAANDTTSGPHYPPGLILGDANQDVVLWLWGKGPVPARRGDEPYLAQDSAAESAEALRRAEEFAAQGKQIDAWPWYQAALYGLPEDALPTQVLREKLAALAADTRLLQAAKQQSAEQDFARARELLALPSPKWPLIAHYVQVARRSLAADDPLQQQITGILTEHQAELKAYLP